MAGVPPKRGEAFSWETELTSQADTDIFQVNPTLAAGDVIVYQDGVLDGNIDTLPTPIGASATVACVLSATEMTANRIHVRFHDVVGAEWQDQSWEFFTVTTPLDEFIAAIWSYATRTLTSFGTLVANIWAYATRTLTQSAASVAAAVAGSIVTVPPYTTWTINLTGLGDLSDRTKLYFTLKESPQGDADTDALIKIEETAGLQIANKATAANAAHGSITVTDAAAGDITIVVDEAVTGFATLSGVYDVKKITATDAVLMTLSTFNISEVVTRTIT